MPPSSALSHAPAAPGRPALASRYHPAVMSELDRAAESVVEFLVRMVNATEDTRLSTLKVRVRTDGPGRPAGFELSYYQCGELAGRSKLNLPAVCSSDLEQVVEESTQFVSNLAHSLRVGEIVVADDLAVAPVTRLRHPALF